MYCIKLGKKYLTRNGNFTNVLIQAYKLDSLQECALFLARKANPDQIPSCVIVDIENETDESTNNIFHRNFNKEALENFEDLKDVYKNVEDMYNLSLKIGMFKRGMERQYKDIELQICDLYHYIENNNLNACDGYKIYRKLHNVLSKRRYIKDCVNILGVLDEIFTDQNIEKLSNIVNSNFKREYRDRIN